MCVLLFDIFKHLLLRKTDVLETCRKSKFPGKKIWRNARLWQAKKYKLYSGKRLFLHYYLQLSFVCKTVPEISFKLFCSEIKGFYQSFLGNDVDFSDIMNDPLNILAKNWNFKKLRHLFVDERALITTALVSSCNWKTLVPFCLRKKRPENAFLTLIVNYHKIVQKNKLCYSKQQ